MDWGAVRAVVITGVYLLVIVAACWVCSCCGPQPDYVTKHGLQVYDKAGIDRADVEAITQKALDLWPTKIHNWRLTLAPAACTWLDHDGWHKTAGYCAESHICVWATKDSCLAKTALGHELLHMFHWIRYDTPGTHAELRELNIALRRQTKGMCDD